MYPTSGFRQTISHTPELDPLEHRIRDMGPFISELGKYFFTIWVFHKVDMTVDTEFDIWDFDTSDFVLDVVLSKIGLHNISAEKILYEPFIINSIFLSFILWFFTSILRTKNTDSVRKFTAYEMTNVENLSCKT